jgi:hypothetical protein
MFCIKSPSLLIVSQDGEPISTATEKKPEDEERTKKKRRCKTCHQERHTDDEGEEKGVQSDFTTRVSSNINKTASKDDSKKNKTKTEVKSANYKKDEGNNDDSRTDGAQTKKPGTGTIEWTSEQDEEIKSMKANGKSWKEIVEKVGVSNQKAIKLRLKELTSSSSKSNLSSKDESKKGDGKKATVEETWEPSEWITLGENSSTGAWDSTGVNNIRGDYDGNWKKVDLPDFENMFITDSTVASGSKSDDSDKGKKMQKGDQGNGQQCNLIAGSGENGSSGGGNQDNTQGTSNSSSNNWSVQNQNQKQCRDRDEQAYIPNTWNNHSCSPNNSNSNWNPTGSNNFGGYYDTSSHEHLKPNAAWSQADCEVLEMLEARYTQHKWYHMQAEFYNWTGRMISAEVIQAKFDEDGAL